MKIATIQYQDQPRLAVWDEMQREFILFHSEAVTDASCQMLTAIRDWNNDRWGDVRKRIEASDDTLTRIEMDHATVLAPLTAPEKIICIGKNYADHAREMGGDAPEIPVVFSKFASALIGPDQSVHLPAISQQVDYEAELVVVIGKSGRDIDPSDALKHVFGYTCGNDVSARDWQKGRPGGQWLVGKTFDTFAPIGPHIVTRDEIQDPHSLAIRLNLNGQTMQDSNTFKMIFSIPFLISHISKFVTLRPGDLIFTGTPEGVGAGRKPPVFLKPGDQLQVEIEKIGSLNNDVR